MKRFVVLLSILLLAVPWPAAAHIGSPDVFYDGRVGPYQASVTIRMPGVVPGRALISLQVRSDDKVTVAFAPISADTAANNAPPPESGEPVPGESNAFTGELWLMTDGAYSIDVHIHGRLGDASVQIPVNSVARQQLALAPQLGWALAALGLVLFCGGVAIVAASAGESVLPPGIAPGGVERRKYWIAAGVTTVIFVLLLVGGRIWWKADEADFHSRLVEGGWPDVGAKVRVQDSRRILSLKLGADKTLPLVRDHGKLLHIFLMRQPDNDAFAHLHPIRVTNNVFDVVLPPLPEGDYELLCDLTTSWGFSSTATNMVYIPPPCSQTPVAEAMKPDHDDSWTTNAAVAAQDDAGRDIVCRLPGGKQVIWKAHSPLRVNQDAGLRFIILDESGQRADLEPYMGMLSHAAVMRSDGRVFTHLHPTGNIAMAAQRVFDKKIARENGAAPNRRGNGDDPICGLAGLAGGWASPAITLPYEFPTAGDYRLWVQFKTGGAIMTAIFDAKVL